MALPCSRPIDEDIKCKLLNLESNIKKTCYEPFFSSYFLPQKKKIKSKIPQTYFLILKAKKANSSTKMDSSSIKLSKELKISKQMKMV
jgi:hypothetical protein